MPARLSPALTLCAALALSACTPPPAPGPQVTAPSTNPLVIRKPDGTRVESCADPNVIRSQAPGDPYWYLYCTTDPHHLTDRDSGGKLVFHLISMARSTDLVNWEYLGDAFSTRPGWVRADAGLWAPEVTYRNGKYYLYYTASETVAGGSAIGVATSPSPAGPWTDSGAAVVEPHAPPGGDPAARRWVFDPDVITDPSGQGWIYYGSYFGGISVRRLSADGLRSDPASQVQVTTDNRYEGAVVKYHAGYYYLTVSASNCCNGPLTGYSVFAGRSTSPTGPFLDRDGVSLLAPKVGGTPVLTPSGNRWVGTGHHDVITDAAGQDWAVYHAIDRDTPYFTPGGINRRPALMDPLDWVGGWPTVRAGQGASEAPRPSPAAQPGQTSGYVPLPASDDLLGPELADFSDDFSGPDLKPAWTWVRPPAAGTVKLTGNALLFKTQAADLFEGSNSASVLARPAPQGDYAVQVRLTSSVPPEGCCFNYVQGGLVVYADDDRYIKLVEVSIWNTRQLEFAKEVPPGEAGFPRYGSMVLAAPGPVSTWLRVVRRAEGDRERYTAYSSRDGLKWTRGGTWTHALGQAKLGLVSMGGGGYQMQFDDFRVWRVQPR